MMALLAGSPVFAASQATAASQSTSASSGAAGSGAENEAAGAWVPEEIVVTAQKRTESINDVGMSINAVSGDQLLALGVTDTSDLTRVVPGFNFNLTAHGNPVYTLRGVGYQDSSLAASPAVTVYVDEVPIPFSGQTLGASMDLERVEVLKGPQGTLFGGNSTGGAINYIAAKPTDQLSAGTNLSFGRFSTIDASAFISGPLSDTFKARAAVRVVNGDDWQKNYMRNDSLGATDQLMGRILADWQPTDALKVSLNINGWRDRSDSPAPQLIQKTQSGIAPFDPEFLAQPFAPSKARAADWNPDTSFERDNDYWQASARIDYELSDTLTLTSITSYQDYNRYVPVDLDATSQHVFLAISSGSVETFFQELRVSGTMGDLNWIVGANYQPDDIKESSFVDFSESTQFYLGPTVDTTNDQETKSKAVYASFDYKIVPNLTVLGGIRYTDYTREFSGCTRDPGDGLPAATFNALFASGAVPGGCLTLDSNFQSGLFKDTLKEDNVSWRAGVNYTINDDILLYANVSKGYKSGSYQTLAAATQAQLEPVTQESLLAYETGFKATLLDRTLQLNGAIFYYDYKDKQIRGIISIPVFGSGEALINVPKSNVTGFELSANWRPIAGLTISPGVTLVDSEIDDDLIGLTPDSTIGNFKGEKFPNTPKWSGNVDLEYRWAFNDSLEAFFGTNVSYQSKTNGGFGGLETYEIKEHTLIDLRVGVEADGGKWGASLWGRNVTDEYYWTTATRASDAGTRFAGLPATYGVALSYRY